MEELIAQTVVLQTCVLPASCSVMMGSFWHWSFWASFVVGVIGGAISFFRRGIEEG